METKVTYERLFNLGGYEHEKFVVTKDLDGQSPDTAMKDMCIQILELEEEIAKFRIAYRTKQELLQRLGWNCEKEEAKAEMRKRIRHCDLVIDSFKLEHQPRNKECKCFYCQNPDYDPDDYED